MLVDLEATVPNNGTIPKNIVEVLGAVETIGLTTLYTTMRKGPDLARAIASVSAASLHKPEAGKTLFLSEAGKEAAARATISESFCVVAIVGSRAEDFPNKATPEIAGARWNRGWFVVPGPNN